MLNFRYCTSEVCVGVMPLEERACPEDGFVIDYPTSLKWMRQGRPGHLQFAPPDGSQATDEQFALIDHFRRQVVVKEQEQLFMSQDFLLPCFAIDGLELVELLMAKV